MRVKQLRTNHSGDAERFQNDVQCWDDHVRRPTLPAAPVRGISRTTSMAQRSRSYDIVSERLIRRPWFVVSIRFETGRTYTLIHIAQADSNQLRISSKVIIVTLFKTVAFEICVVY